MNEQEERRRAERRGLGLSIFGALMMAALGIGFAVLTSSDAVLLDGVFSLIGFVVGLLALRVATLVTLPDDEVYHFGYAAFEPMLNLTKGLLMAFISLFAMISSVIVIVEGGRSVEASWAVAYAVLAAAGCFTIAGILWSLSKRTHSPLLEVDTHNWIIDGFMSVSVAIAFVITILLNQTSLSWFVPYADASVVIVLVVACLPLPAKIIWQNWGQLVGRSPDRVIRDRAQAAIDTALEPREVETNLRVQQIGRYVYFQVYVLTNEDDCRIADLDRCRSAVAEALSGFVEHLALDVSFTRDARWVDASIGKGMVGYRDRESGVESDDEEKAVSPDSAGGDDSAESGDSSSSLPPKKKDEPT